MKPKFNIGDLVEAYPSKLEYEKKNTGKVRKDLITKDHNKIKGVIVGAVYRYIGELNIGGFMGVLEPDYDPSCFTSEKGILFWQIRQGYLNKPVEALEEDIRVIERVYSGWLRLVKKKDVNKIPNKIPWKYVGEKYKEHLSEVMKKEFKENPDSFPRDEKGRFV